MVRAIRTRAAASTVAVALDDRRLYAWHAALGHRRGQTRVNAEAALAAEFAKRVEQYMAVHEKVHKKGGVPGLPKETTPEEIDKYQRALARRFSNCGPRPSLATSSPRRSAPYFRRQLDSVFGGPEGARAAGVDHGRESRSRFSCRSTADTPTRFPSSTMPPQVLAALPKLPQELEYRFIGERLILLDEPAHLIVDYIDDALPN